jgi:hypothetical protein
VEEAVEEALANGLEDEEEGEDSWFEDDGDEGDEREVKDLEDAGDGRGVRDGGEDEDREN